MRARAWLRAIGHQGWLGYGAGLAAVGLVSGLIGLVFGRIPIANISMLYLIAVLAVAVAFGSGPAVVASVAAVLAFDYFFVEPVHTFTVSDPSEWVALLLFLVTAIVTGQLAAGQRRRAQEAEQREREAVVLYDIARLMADPALDDALRAVAARLLRELDLAAVAIALPNGPQGPRWVAVGDETALRCLQAAALAPVRVLGRGRPPTEAERGQPGRWVRVWPARPPRWGPERRDGLHVVPLEVEGRRVGSLLVMPRADAGAFPPAADRLLSAVAAQLGLASERARLRQEATEAEILRRTDELRTALLNAVSHDLRTPLASIIASVGSLRQQGVQWTDAERREFLEAIETEAHRLDRIVGNLLDVSRVEAGSIRPERDWHDLAALVDDVLGRLRTATARHRLVVDIPDDLPPVLLDYVEIGQVLTNLVENAAKYTPPGTEIRIRARLEAGQVRVEVADRGPGLPETALPRLFQPFYRAESGDGRPRPHGTGLGLAVAKGLVEAHGGRIWAENRRGGGARFCFTLPHAAPTAAPALGEAR
ncbi:MAG TPA: ATP-binding protein [Chloroflexota bacterium]|nr:ATP-binding protein [Chloroflexota bacterium]